MAIKRGQFGTSLNVSPDGNLVAFTSGSTNLVAGGSSGPQLFVKDLSTGEISIASTSKDGEIGNGYSNNAIFSFDGTKIAFESTASNLAGLVNGAGDTTTNTIVFIKTLNW